LPNAGNTAVLANNLTIHGSLQVEKGRFQIYVNDASSAIHVPITLDVKNDVVVFEDGVITTGTASTHNGLLPVVGTTPGSLVTRYYDVYHKVYIGGSLFNNGLVQFISSDITSIDFANLTSRGAATVRFYGLSNEDVVCNGTTDFYNLLIDKGTDPSVELKLDVSAPQNFRLFGANIYSAGSSGVNPELRKALWIRNGTLRLTGYATIASLTEGMGGTHNSSYVIPANGAMVLDGSNVTVLVTADNEKEVVAAWGVSSTGVHIANQPQELHIRGRLVMNDGYLSTRFSGGILFNTASGEMIVNGGHITTRQIRSAGTGPRTFSMNGGHIDLLGGFAFDTSGDINDINDLRNVPFNYVHTGLRLDGTASLHWVSAADLFIMTGGSIDIYNTSGGGTSRAIRILSDAANMDVSGGDFTIRLLRNTNYDLEVPNSTFPGLTIRRDEPSLLGWVRLMSDINIHGDLQLIGHSRLWASYNSISRNVNVSGDFLIDENALYNPYENTTRFYGSENSQFIVNGTIESNLNSLAIEKDESELQIVAPIAVDELLLRGNLSILSGTFNDSGKTITVNGDIFNSGVHTGTGKILLSNATTRTIGGDGTGVFQNLELDEDVSTVNMFASDQKVSGTLKIKSGILNLNKYGLSVDGQLTSEGGFSVDKMIVTDGNSSDKGLRLSVNANGNMLFPIGSSANEVVRYTPATVTVSDFVDEGWLQVNPVAEELPLLDQESEESALQYYWRIRHQGFTDKPSVAYQFTYSDLDLSEEDDDLSFVPGMVIGAERFKLDNGVDVNTNTITFATAQTLSEGSYTAAHPDRFDGLVPVFYSRICGSWGANWSNGNTWSKESHTGVAAGEVPGAGDIVYIGNGGGCNLSGGGNFHWIVADTDINIGELNFTTAPEGVWSPRLIIPNNRVVNINKIAGEGTVFISVSSAEVPQITADWGEFLEHDKSNIIYSMVNNGTAVIPSITDDYPNLRFEAEGNTSGNRFVVIPNNITVRGTLRIDRGATLLLNEESSGDVQVLGNTQIGGNQFGRLLFPGDGVSRNFLTRDLTIVATEMGASNSVTVQNAPEGGAIHRLAISKNLTQEAGTIDLFTNNTGGSNVELMFTGTENAVFNVNGGSIPDLYRLVIDKGVNQTSSVTVNSAFTLGAPVNTAVKALNLLNGNLVLNHPDINLELTSGGGMFSIPLTSYLRVSEGKLFVTEHNTGVNLIGKLRVDNNGVVELGTDINNNRIFIQYQGVGAELEIADNGKLEVQSQIRRPTNTFNGVLKYRQTGGEVIIHGRNPSQARAKLEVVNDGSEFTMSGGLLSFRRGAGTTFGDLYLMPDNASISGGQIRFSQEAINANQTYRINSSIALADLSIAGNPVNNRSATLSLMNLPLSVNGTFNFENNLARFNSNNRDVYLAGDLNFDGTWTHGTDDTVVFTGDSQTVSGGLTVNNLSVNVTSNVTLASGSSVVANCDLNIVSGQLIDGGNSVTVVGHITNNAVMVSSEPTNLSSGLKMAGGMVQKISGNGTFGLLEIYNASGVTLENNITLANNLILTNGLLNIQGYTLTLDVDADVVSGVGFSADNMIVTDGAFGNNSGIRKMLPIGSSSSVLPVGTIGKYTPVEIITTANSTSGDFMVKPINQYHPTADDPDNVLQYFWVLSSNGISNYSGDIVFTYVQSDVRGNESEYLGARLQGFEWSKFLDVVDEVDNSITISFSGVNSLSGDYTAGLDLAIPDEVPLFRSVTSGDWTNPLSWERDGGGTVPANGPFGHRVIIEPTHTITMSVNSRRIYTTEINGKLEIGTTYGHNLGVVTGNGTLSMHSNQLPAGRFEDFFKCDGGIIEYGGSASYTISDRYPLMRGLVISGSGVKTLPNTAVTICEDVTVTSGTLKISHFGLGAAIKNTYINGNLIINAGGVFESDANEYVHLKGNLVKEGFNNFRNQYAGQRFIFNGTERQVVSGLLSGSNQRFYDLQINNAAGVEFTNNAEVANYFYNTSGNVVMPDGYKFILTKTDGLANPTSATSYVEGFLSRNMVTGSTHAAFNIGKSGQRRVVSLTNRTGATAYWGAEYMDSGFNADSFAGDIERVSALEHFKLQSPGVRNATITLPINSEDVVIKKTIDLADLRIVKWNGTAWVAVGSSVVITGNKVNGTVATSSAITMDGSEQLFAIGTVEPIAFYWTGDVDDDWYNSGNWDENTVPGANNNSVIPFTVNQPVVRGVAVAQTKGLLVDNNAILTLASGGKLTVNGNLAIVQPGGLVMENQTGGNGMSSLIVNGDVSGQANMKLTLPPNRWFYLGSSIKDPVFSNFGAGNEGVIINVFRNGSWWGIGSGLASRLLRPMEGMVTNLLNDGLENRFINYTGQLHTTAVSRTYAETGYHLFANPYPGFISWEDAPGWERSAIDGTIWYRGEVGDDMAFITYNRNAVPNAKVALYPNGAVTHTTEQELSLIPPMQAVWVKALSAGANLTVGLETRRHGINGSMLKSSSSRHEGDVIRIEAENSFSRDGMVIYFASGSEEGIDAGDSEKYFNDSERIPEIYTRVEDKSLAINGLPLITTGTRIIPLSVRNRVEGEVTLRFNLDNYFGYHSPYLRDNETGAFVHLMHENSYTYTVSRTGDNHDRFELHFYYVTTDIEPIVEDPLTVAGITIRGMEGKALVSIQSDLLQTGDALIEVFSIEGRKLSEVPALSSRTLVVLPQTSGIYIVRVTLGSLVKSERVIGNR
jgi:hypothetical protein